MGYLLLVSLIWPFSFGLIGHELVGLDANFKSLIRLMLSFLVFAPFLRRAELSVRLRVRLVLLGAVQYGIMYMAYMAAYDFLPSHLVALYTVFTPLYVTVLHDCARRRFHRVFLLTALMAVAAAAFLKQPGQLGWLGGLYGFLMVQVSNLCFAFGQIGYRLLMEREQRCRNRDVFGWMYLGAVLVSLLPALLTTPWGALAVSGRQWLVLLYLGVVPSGICFFLWNVGATRVNVGTLAVFNNAKVPLAMLVSLVLFREQADLVHVVIGGVIIATAVIVNERTARVRAESAVQSFDNQQTGCGEQDCVDESHIVFGVHPAHEQIAKTHADGDDGQ